ncbi:MAG: PilZ domain-containing protein [Chitinispirillaceae bacterium]|jgi:hypothetical protein|nr:PilZ domain-containing protein [Chitinispirillaceae bacterium]
MKKLSLIPVLLLPGFVDAAVDYRWWSLPVADTPEIFVMIVLLVSAAIGFSVFEVIRSRREKAITRVIVDERFLENARRFGLNAEESEVLKSMVLRVSADPNEVFESLFVFEVAVDVAVSAVLAAGDRDAAHADLAEVISNLRRKLHYTVVEPTVQIGSTRNLGTGQTVWILGSRNAVAAEGVVTRVEEFFFSVKIPAPDAARLPAFSTTVRMAFTRKTDGIYGIEVPLVSSDPSNMTITCRHTLKFKRNQLRQDVRVDTDLSISIRCIGSASLKPGAVLDTSSFMVKLIDLSGGGLAFASEKQIAKGDTILIAAASSKLTLSGVRAKVIAVSPSKTSARIVYHVQFVNIDFEKKEKIIKYVFTRMRELTQR